MTMLFNLETIDRNGQERLFSFQTDNLELGLDMISQFVSTGIGLIAVNISGDIGTFSLPVEAFDGELLSLPISQLKRQWHQVLSESV